MKLLITLVAMFVSSAAFADKCPDLRGTFVCPAAGGSAGFLLNVTETGSLHRTMHYHWSRSDGTSNESYASVKGEKNEDGTYGVCHNKGLYLSPMLNDLSSAYRQEVNLKGNYVITTFMNEPVMTCLRVARKKRF